MDPFDLSRFVEAQELIYKYALGELKAGRKRTHWMWFVFPQLKGLGTSSNSLYFGLSGIDEAQAYLKHPVLGPRLRECAEAVNAVGDKSAEQILGAIDARKYQSSMTLFETLDNAPPVYGEALEKYFSGLRDQRTLDILG